MRDNIKDVLPVASNSSDKRRPLLMTSPRERQNRRKEVKITSPIIESLTEQINQLEAKLAEQSEVVSTSSVMLYTEEELNTVVSDKVNVIESSYKREIAKLKKELTKKETLIQELEDKLVSNQTYK